eukprot:m.41667 g.41667  ORF g.41667 m.41667 type:complete len:65 (-) comp11847_c1_seq1:38-232(-)
MYNSGLKLIVYTPHIVELIGGKEEENKKKNKTNVLCEKGKVADPSHSFTAVSNLNTSIQLTGKR